MIELTRNNTVLRKKNSELKMKRIRIEDLEFLTAFHGFFRTFALHYPSCQVRVPRGVFWRVVVHTFVINIAYSHFIQAQILTFLSIIDAISAPKFNEHLSDWFAPWILFPPTHAINVGNVLERRQRSSLSDASI